MFDNNFSRNFSIFIAHLADVDKWYTKFTYAKEFFLYP